MDIPDVLLLGVSSKIFKLDVLLESGDRSIVYFIGREGCLCRVAAQFNLSLVVTFSKFLQDEMAFSALRQCAQPEEMFAALNKIVCVEPARNWRRPNIEEHADASQ